MKTRGMVLGKFMPPHLGHMYLVDFARHYVDELYVVVGTLKSEPIDGNLRFRWMQQLFEPACRVLHLTDENPQEPHEHPDFWQIWQRSLQNILPGKIDYVFASEQYGYRLAEVLSASFVPCDQARQVVPVSGTKIRNNPLAYWQYLPRPVRPYFLKKVCLFGPESAGKSTLAEKLARHFNTVHVPEYARTVLDKVKENLAFKDMERIARGQAASEDALGLAANRLLVCDTDHLTSRLWSRHFFNRVPSYVEEQVAHRHYDLTLLLKPDIPWVKDSARFMPGLAEREQFFEKCRNVLEKENRTYQVISGNYTERLEQAISVVEKILVD